MTSADTLLEWSQLHAIEVEPLIIYRGEVTPETRRMTTQPPYLSWWLVLRGTCVVHLLETRWEASAGQWIALPAGISRAHDFTADAEILSISFNARWAGGNPLLRLAQPLVARSTDYPELAAAGAAVCDLVETVRGGGRRPVQALPYSLGQGLELRSRLDTFVRALLDAAQGAGGTLTPPSGEDSRLDLVLEHLRAELRAGPLPYAQWSRLTGLSRTQVDRLALAHLHLSLRQHRDHLLLAEASRRLTLGDLPIKQIAAELGFVDTAHFCRWIRQQTGHSPLELRRQAVA